MKLQLRDVFVCRFIFPSFFLNLFFQTFQRINFGINLKKTAIDKNVKRRYFRAKITNCFSL